METIDFNNDYFFMKKKKIIYGPCDRQMYTASFDLSFIHPHLTKTLQLLAS